MSAVIKNTLHLSNIDNNGNFAYLCVILQDNNADITKVTNSLSNLGGVDIVERSSKYIFLKLNTNKSFSLTLTLTNTRELTSVLTLLYLGNNGKITKKQSLEYKEIIPGFKKFHSSTNYRRIQKDNDFKRCKELFYKHSGVKPAVDPKPEVVQQVKPTTRSQPVRRVAPVRNRSMFSFNR